MFSNQTDALNLSNNTSSISIKKNCPAPIISTFSPLTGPENTLITISGVNFLDVVSVQFEGMDVGFSIINDTEINAFAPATLSMSSQIVLISSGGCIGTSPNSFTLIEVDCNSGNDEIYISEVYDSDGGSYGVFELYNPTNSTINLSTVYEIERYGNIGDAAPSNTIPLAGSINPFDTFIIEMGSTGNTCSGLLPNITLAAGINANDEIRLLKNTLVIDVIYTDDEIGYTFIRNADAVAPSSTFNINDWTLSETEDCSNLRMHTEDPITIPNITQPVSQDVCENGSTSFSVSVDTGTYTYQWKVLNATGNWVNVVNNANYSGATTNVLMVNNIPLSFDGNQYYCEITSANCDLLSVAVQLQIISPEIDTISDQNVCTEYTLPVLTNGNYFSLTGGNGTTFSAGDIITTTQTIFIYNEVGTAPDICFNESSFTVTVAGTPLVDTISDQNVCTDYTLPALINGNYFSLSGGNGTAFNVGDIITTTQTIFIYNEVGTAPDTCSNESSFTITVSGTPLVDTISDQNVCSDFTLPVLTNGNYFSLTGGNGTTFSAGDIITTTQTIFIYNEIGTAPDTCSNESSFTITVTGTPLVDTISDQNVCTEYTLLALTNGNYFSLSGGNGTSFSAGDIITTTQTIFIYNEIGTAPNICSNESSFTITVSTTPLVDTILDQTVCSDFTLPVLTNGNYFSLSGGTGTIFSAGDIITTTQTIFIYNIIGTPPDTCSNESSFTITVSSTPLVDVISDQNVCSDFALPALTNGNYFSASGGTGTTFSAGDIITATQTIFIYNETGIAPNTCSNESSFIITVSGTPLVDTILDQNVCSDFTLPVLTNGSYFSLSGGTGTTFSAGDIISTTQTIFIYNEFGTPPDTCSNETSFTVTISGTPLVDTILDQNVCSDFTLPVLTNGNYFSASGGTGSAFSAGDIISTTQTIFIYNEIGTAPDTCSNESSFIVTVSGTPLVDTIPDQNLCTDFILPVLTNGNYFSATGGTGTTFSPGDIISTTQTIFIYNEFGTPPDTCSNETSFTVTVNSSTDFSLTEANIEVLNGTLIVNMSDQTLNYEYAVTDFNFQTDNTFSNIPAGSYLLFVREIDGCFTKSIIFEITLDLFIPKFLTPNGDGFKDTWKIIDRNNIIKDVYIFDRYGKLLKHIIGTAVSWDGTFNGKALGTNDFWYIINLRTTKQLKGHFTLKR
ncbi:T9SS type B sorting domain-containing protein [Psychroserpens jangbogonensis]|uniref:T9SS type B sorting domain-containing protein n=1 Tax=Psychroserpens jangbogonensis TaxID=1484460 RepID=UPI00126A5C75|nr:T9SS type B sorting domain-containing protein [Psychroserpens jangbogonensis]